MLLCPPIDPIVATVKKLARTGEPDILIILDFPRQPWHHATLGMKTVMERLTIRPGKRWVARREMNPDCCLLQL